MGVIVEIWTGGQGMWIIAEIQARKDIECSKINGLFCESLDDKKKNTDDEAWLVTFQRKVLGSLKDSQSH